MTKHRIAPRYQMKAALMDYAALLLLIALSGLTGFTALAMTRGI